MVVSIKYTVLVVIILFSFAANGDDDVAVQGNKHDDIANMATTVEEQPPSCTAGMLVHDDEQEAEIRRQLLQKAPPNRYQINLPPYHVVKQTPIEYYKTIVWKTVHDEMRPKIHPDFDKVDAEIQAWWKRFKNKELSYDETLAHTETLRKSYDEMLSKFNDEKDRWNDVVDQELQRRWKEELSEDDRLIYTEELQSHQTAWRAYMQSKDGFQKELLGIVAKTTLKNQIAKPIQPHTRRYPDHEFAIKQSYIVFNWSIANFFLFFLEESSETGAKVVPQAMIAESNIPGKIPVFVDSWWHGLNLGCPKRRKAFEDMPEEEQELKWTETAYYKVYPPDDVYTEGNDDGYTEAYASWGHSLRFNRTSVRQFLQLVWEDIQGGKQWTKDMFSAPVFTPDSNTGQLKAKVTAFRSQLGDRIELWEEKEEDDAYAILQTHRGRLVAIAVSGGHAYLLCNLLEFYNSDGSMDMPDLVSDLDNPKQFARNILTTAESFLYNQMH